MIKGIFFDWFNTLAHYDPPREEIYRSAFKEHGIDISFNQVYRGLLEGDRQYFALKAKGIIKSGPLSEIADILTLYPAAICKAADVSASSDIYLKVIRQALKNYKSRTVLYDDVLPLFNVLKSRNYVLGIITNADQSVIRLINELGAGEFLKVIITSEAARAEKPEAAIFNAAYRQADLQPDEMLYVGDQYKSDILGAVNAGSRAILLDRYDMAPEVKDCPRISSLDQVPDLI